MEYKFVEPKVERIMGKSLSEEYIVPADKISLDDALMHLEKFPNDIFMAHYVFDIFSNCDMDKLDVKKYSSNPYVLPVLVDKGIVPLGNREVSLLSRNPVPVLRAYGKNKKEKELIRRAKEIETHVPGDTNSRDEYLGILASLAGKEMSKKYSGIESKPFKEKGTDIDTGTSLRETDLEKTYEKIINTETLEKLDMVFISPFIYSMGTYCVGIVRDSRISSPDGHIILKGFQANSGKGIGERHALLSGIMEVIERFSAEMRSLDGWPDYYINCHDITKGSYSEMKKNFENTLNPNLCSLDCHYDDESIYWAKGMTSKGDEIYVPADMAFFHAFMNVPVLSGNTNGISSGNTLHDAKLQSLLELIERDGFYHSVGSKNYRLEAVSPPMENVLEEYEKCGMKLMLKDHTSDFGIPVFEAYSYLGENKDRGFGADLNSQRAVTRAVCELNAGIAGASEYPGRKAGKAGASRDFEKFPVVEFENLPNYSSNSVKQDVRRIEDIMNKNGFDVIYIDLTMEDIGVPVIRTIIPGLENGNYNKRLFSHLHKAVEKKYRNKSPA